jgi:hypothetical protein
MAGNNRSKGQPKEQPREAERFAICKTDRQPAPVISIAKRPICAATVQTLEKMLKAARDGDLIGLAYAAMYSGSDFDIDLVGECERAPTFTLGMLSLLDDRIAKRIMRSPDV